MTSGRFAGPWENVPSIWDRSSESTPLKVAWRVATVNVSDRSSTVTEVAGIPLAP
jgi:hypothetical protein